MPISSKNARAFARVRAIAFAVSAVSFLAVLLAPLSAFAATPRISGTPATTAKVGVWYNFIATVSDADGDELRCVIQNAPAWAVFNKTRCQLSDVPTSSEVGTYSNIRMGVTDGTSTAWLPAFSITVTGPSSGANSPPRISGTPPTTARVGVWYNFIATISDPNGDPLRCSIQNPPAWAVFNRTRCQLSDIPTSAEVGTYSNIIISVSDGRGGVASLPPFSITVSTSGTTNRPPTISGTPPTTARTGVAYAFTPTASDPEGRTLTFSIANKPAWAAFSTTTGRLSGTPSSTQTGTYSNIVIRVTDGVSTVSLPAFAIVVSSTATTGSATLSWTPPTQNTNGTTLTNLAGYRILYGTSATSLTRTIQVANAGVSRYVVENLAPGGWYFSVRAYTTTGAESAGSNTAYKTVP
ncbi:MAG TPA: putative Ig domain-containing protein [Steroidobacteraceae bacterium]|nr:putative Ig domain-containing protein [Steroidobacteraceae bacterium]